MMDIHELLESWAQPQRITRAKSAELLNAIILSSPLEPSNDELVVNSGWGLSELGELMSAIKQSTLKNPSLWWNGAA